MPDSRLPPLAAILLLPALLGACEAREADNRSGPAAAAPTVPAKKPEPLQLPAPALDRAALLSAVAQAASAHAAGSDDAAAQAALDGHRFAIRMRFGCAGPSAPDSGAALQWRAKSGSSLELSATPDLSLDAPALAGLDTETVEAVEGFWIARPWLLSDACPAPHGQGAAPAAPAERSVGIAQYYTADESRVERRSGRAYVSVEPIETDTPPPRDGFFLLLEGRLRSWPGGKPIRCVAAAPGARPACIVSMRLDRVAFTRPGDGGVIDEWTP